MILSSTQNINNSLTISIVSKLFSLTPSRKKISNLPNLEHCIGKDRLLGEYYGQALSESLHLMNMNHFKNLNELCVLLRSFIVLDDYLKDKQYSLANEDYIITWLRNIKSRINELINELGGHFSLWGKYFKEYEQAYNFFNPSDCFNYTHRKCSFVFLPFELPIFIANEEHKSIIINFIKYFLFSLQLIDDFKDMEEDIISHKNHNLYLSKLTKPYSKKIIIIKSILLMPLLDYIRNNISKVHTNTLSSNVLSVFYENCMDWLNINTKKFSNFQSDIKFKNSFENWEPFNEKTTNDLFNRFNKYDFGGYNIDSISAESIHSLSVRYQGISHGSKTK